MEKTLLPKLGLKHTFTVPKSQMNLYAQGYSKDSKPSRMSGPSLISKKLSTGTSTR